MSGGDDVSDLSAMFQVLIGTVSCGDLGRPSLKRGIEIIPWLYRVFVIDALAQCQKENYICTIAGKSFARLP